MRRPRSPLQPGRARPDRLSAAAAQPAPAQLPKDPDAALLHTCAAVHRAKAARDRAEAALAVADPERDGPRFRALERHGARLDAVVDRAAGVAARTVQGLVAQAGAALAVAERDARGAVRAATPEQRLAWAVTDGVARLCPG